MANADQMMADARRQLLEVREQRGQNPTRSQDPDRRNALMISGVLDAYQALGNPQYLSMGERSARVLLSNAYKKGRLFRTMTDGKAA